MFSNITLTGFADEIDASLDKQLQVIKKLNIHFIEMRGVDGKCIVDYPLSDVHDIKKKLDQHNVKLSAIGSPIGKISITDPFEDHFALFKHTVEIAHIMETQYIRMFSFFIPNGEDPGNYRDEVLSRLEQFVRYAKDNDVVLLHENEKAIYGDTAPRCLDIMKHFYGSHFKAVFDFANFVQCRQDTLEAYEMLKPYIAYVHIKDAIWENGKVVPAGMGDGNLKTILSMMKKDGYAGFLSLEPHLQDFDGFSHLEQNNIKVAKTMSGEEAFTLACHSLNAIIEQLN